MKSKMIVLVAIAAATAVSSAAPEVRITEKMYTGLFGEFVEITNVGDDEQDMAGWEYTDSEAEDFVDLSPIGTLDADESAIITEADEAVFDLVWYGTFTGVAKPAGLVIIDNVTVNLGRNDAVQILDNNGLSADTLTYNDQGSGNVDGFRTEEVSAVPGPLTAFGTDNYSTWILSVDGVNGAWKSGNHAANANGTIGSPGYY